VIEFQRVQTLVNRWGRNYRNHDGCGGHPRWDLRALIAEVDFTAEVGAGRTSNVQSSTTKSDGDRGLMQTVIVRDDPPPARPYGVSDEEAVELCRDWMIYLGAADTVAASGDARELCDLYSSSYVAWVHNERGNLEQDEVARAAHLSSADGRRALIFVRGGVLPDAQQLADKLGVAVFWFGATDGSLEGGSRIGFDVRASGLAGG
jgi:hypothetical protein